MTVKRFLLLANKNSRTTVANVIAELANKKKLVRLCTCETNVDHHNMTRIKAIQAIPTRATLRK